MGFPNIRGIFLGVPIIRSIVYWGLYWGPLILGNYHMSAAGEGLDFLAQWFLKQLCCCTETMCALASFLQFRFSKNVKCICHRSQQSESPLTH